MIWKREPVLIQGVIQMGLALILAFGVDLTLEQTGGILAFTAAVLALITRTQVTPNDSVE